MSGHQPYNANQQNENDNNKNRVYAEIDKRIKETFIKQSTAQKTKLYDMYSRFYRWAMDRLTENGVIAFITNRSFIDSRTFDGFRKIIAQEFDHAYIIDTKSDVRANPKIAGTTHNVFGIQAGVAILFLVKSTYKQIKPDPCKISYIALDDFMRKEEKWQWFSENDSDKIEFENITPDKNGNWINMADNDWDSLIPSASKEVKSGKSKGAIFELHSLGIATNRDEWTYDFNRVSLQNKVQYFITKFNNEVERWKQSDKNIAINDFVSREIKWTEELEAQLKKNTKLLFDVEKIKTASYRPFGLKSIYYQRILVHRLYQQNLIYPVEYGWDNKSICIHSISADHSIIVFSYK